MSLTFNNNNSETYRHLATLRHVPPYSTCCKPRLRKCNMQTATIRDRNRTGTGTGQGASTYLGMWMWMWMCAWSMCSGEYGNSILYVVYPCLIFPLTPYSKASAKL